MCYEQIVHTSCHANVIGFCADEREHHGCDTGRGCNPYSDGAGRPCPLHSCCWVRIDVANTCEERTADGMCAKLMDEEIFLPREMESEEVCMEFWPEDEAGKKVFVFLEDAA
jgi:hypothetical protein